MTTLKTPWRMTTITALAALALIAAPIPAAFAHDNLIDASPAAGETVTQLDDVLLTFSGELIDFSEASFAQIKGPDGLFYETTCSTIDRNMLSTAVALGQAGTYTVIWNAVSSDGHPISEGYEFTYAPPADVASVLGWDEPACGNEENRTQPGASTPAPAPDPATEADVTPSAESPSVASPQQDETTGIIIPIILGAVVLGAGVVLIPFIVNLVRKRRGLKRDK